MRFLVRLVVNAVALWLTTLIVSGVTVTPFGDGDTTAVVLTFLLVAFVFGLVNAVIGTIIRIVAFPLYVLTLGLISLIVNAVLLLIVAGISDAIGFGLEVESFGWGIVGAFVLAVFSWLIGLFVRPVLNRPRP
ncbi:MULTISPECIES: phage holin family protein [unclassified Curtobacterium]|jgi:putative membrane protein|uniref:phage holin family protein n=1 Tax=unclassified Curtobacterium TaxID=257496 RepID=UPI00052ADFA6|nr:MULTISPECIES: phage holin family protein [unclassified Curtobacterium]AIV39312.1 membrane protein [Curtobacterium sp. MR_MD2014]MBP1301489.1 putative membrane protein [Curtobacterium sp. 1310]MCM3503653.1 phage holin family protein [Curtobacterium sp. ODYSSEY 48 V2]MCM3520994.1 phage holin family protein [Curtobacterium sp. P97]MDB6427959.1 phage holin family protein [Curtobacterium sp. 20TX0008]